MCGIAGMVRTDGGAPESALLERMQQALRRRGPDGAGVWIGGPCGLAHARLAVIDLAGGAQPLGNEDGSVQITFNGEIYDYRALREGLGDRHRFRTRSDTEVVVHLYEELGQELLAKLHGFFAFALWDARRDRLLLARDRLGKKPLFFARLPDRLLFASQPAALLAAWPGRPEPDPAALDDVLALRYVAGGRSGFAGIEKLLPGELAVFEDGALRRKRWWSPPAPSGSAGHPAAGAAIEMDEAVAGFRERFDRAVAMRLESEVPLGLLLSGGIDSTAVLESLSRSAPGRVRTFTVGFSREKESEAPAARLAAEHFRSEHREFELGEQDLLAEVDQVLPLLDEPFGDPSFLPTALICRRAREEVTVCLTGDGGDELFGGYARYRETLAEREGPGAVAGPARLARALLPYLPRHRFKAWKLARSVRSALASPEQRYVARLVATEAPLRRELLGERSREAVEPGRPERELTDGLVGPGAFADRMMALDVRHYLPGLILTKADRASMSTGLELRSPLLDSELLEWAARVPHALKIGQDRGKLVMRKALEGRVPPALLERGKRGFGTPLGRWFRHELRPVVDDCLLGSRLAEDGWLDRDAIAAAVRAHRARARNLGELLWTLLALEVWYRRWVLGSRASGQDTTVRSPQASRRKDL